ncbi:MAG: hypothetical protein CVU08_12125 [Bacteroidetes bacterium HGW-Bacteroidetes-3]|nr:MAG: hypothetical protein CVU08_12125 [Bacteroidetes bacterium HGW-Bacteroidetes-3]
MQHKNSSLFESFCCIGNYLLKKVKSWKVESYKVEKFVPKNLNAKDAMIYAKDAKTGNTTFSSQYSVAVFSSSFQ